LLGFLLFLSGCNTREAAPIADASPTATPFLLPTPTPHASPTPRPQPRIIYGIQTKRRVFALTFDDGPDPTWTPKILAILQKWHAPATFFMVGKMVRAHPQFALKVQAAKFPIGNHSWSHPRTSDFPAAEIERTDAIIQRVLGFKPTLFRPPYGILNNGLAKVALSRGEDVIVWNSLGADWDKRATPRSIESKVLHRARPGGIALLHDGGGNRAKTVAALPFLIDHLRKRGFRFVTLPELLKMGPPIPLPVPRKPRPKRSNPPSQLKIPKITVRKPAG